MFMLTALKNVCIGFQGFEPGLKTIALGRIKKLLRLEN
jgi:hypothetical protein